MSKNIPILKGFYSNKMEQVHVWCPHCNMNHYHGLDKDMISDKGSHRNAHCVKNNFKDGYIIKLYRPEELDEIKEEEKL